MQKNAQLEALKSKKAEAEKAAAEEEVKAAAVTEEEDATKIEVQDEFDIDDIWTRHKIDQYIAIKGETNFECVNLLVR